MTEGLEQQRRSVRVLQLLGESHVAHEAGEAARCSALIQEAAELDVTALTVIHGGMLIGEIPRPGDNPDAWWEYLASAEGALAQAEAEAS